MKKILFTSLLLVVFSFGYSQTKNTKPFLKLVIKDGKIVETEKLNDIVSTNTRESENNATLVEINDSILNMVSFQKNSDKDNTPNIESQQNKSTLNQSIDKNNQSLTKTSSDYNQNSYSNIFLTTNISSDQKQTKGNAIVQIADQTNNIECFDTFDISKYNKISDNKEKKDSIQEINTLATEGWTTLLSETFEGAFPNNWNIFNNSTQAYWDDVSYRSYNGSYSGFCAGGGSQGVTPGSNYPNNMSTWMITGPFNLSDAVDGNLSFKLWNNSELSYDYFGYYLSLNGEDFSGYITSGNTNGWITKNIDLTNVYTLGNVLGQSQVWVGFKFSSDASNVNEGAFIDDILFEKNTGNGIDLEASNLNLCSTTWTTGDQITGTLTETNSGSTTSGSHYSRLYLSSDNTISSTDTKLGEDITFGSIQASGSSSVNLSFNVPSVSDGTYYIGVIVDYYNNVSESDETNNIGLWVNTVDVVNSGPDLASVSLALSTDVWCPGSQITTDLTEINNGSVTAGSHVSLIYLSINNSISNADTQLGGNIAFTSIAAGASSTVSQSFTAPSVSDGTYYMGVIVDYYNTVTETDESNNIAVRNGTINVGCIGPDLIWTSLSINSDTWCPGDQVTADLIEQNIGTYLADAHYTRLYLSTDNSITSSDTKLGTDLYYSSIAASSTRTVNQIFTTPSLTDGTYYLGAMVDYYNDVTELDELNNIGFRGGTIEIIDITPPNIYIDPVTISIYEPLTGSQQITESDNEKIFVPVIDKSYILEETVDENGDIIQKIIINGKPPKDFRVAKVSAMNSATSVILPNAPAFSWSFGCSATSAAMIAGYYDNNGFSDMYTGPTNGGLMPLSNSVWGSIIDDGGDVRNQCPLSATRMGIDGRTMRGHVDDYWITYGNEGPDPFITNGWTEHVYGDCTADFMRTNQSIYDNSDGSTSFYYSLSGSQTKSTNPNDGLFGFNLFLQSRGYTVEDYYNQYIYGYDGNTSGFTFEQFKQEIDNGRPVILHVEGHSMVGVGYDTENTVYLHDTWDYSTHSMTWGGTYSQQEMQHYAVSVIQLEESATATNNFIINNIGGSTLTVNSIVDNKNWLTTSGYSLPLNIEAGGSASISFDVNWALLSDQETSTITINSNDPDKASVTIQIEAYPANEATPPIADFEAEKTNIGKDESVTFYDLSQNDPTCWDWSFPGGQPSSSNQEEPVITYNTAGIYSVTLTATNSDGSDTKTIEDYIHVSNCSIPDEWTINESDYAFSGQVTAQVLVEGFPVETGVLAAFVGSQCRGIALPTYFSPSDHYVFNLMCYSNQGSGEVLEFKYLDFNTCEICELSESITFSSDMIIGNAISPTILNCSSCNVDVEISLNKNWTWFSINVDLEDHSINTVLNSLTPTQGDYIKNQYSSATYYTGVGWWGDLEEIVPGTMYMIKMANTDQIVLQGCETDYDMPIPLNKNWTWVGYLPQDGLAINTVLGALTASQGDYIKNQISSATYYNGIDWWGDLGTMQPFDGYKIKTANQGTLIYTIPSNHSKSVVLKDVSLLFNNEVGEIISYNNFEFNGSLTAEIYQNIEIKSSENDLLLAYVGDQCRGITKSAYFNPNKDYLFQLMVYSNIVKGEIITFKYYNFSEDRLYDCNETYPFETDMSTTNALSPMKLSLKTGSLAIDELIDNMELSVYPNPFENILNIDLIIKEASNVKITVFDICGKKLHVITDNWVLPGSYNLVWDAKDYSSGAYFIRMISDQKSTIKKVILK